MRVGELCAGYNGLGMAVEAVFGATPAWFSEYDAAPSKILAHHYPNVPNYGDMTAIDWAAIEPADIISGGTPCQDLSGAGRRAGMTEGTRSNLWVQMREAIAIQQPAYVVWENVRGAFSAEASSEVEQCQGCLGDARDGRVFLRALGRVLGDLSDLGYDTQWRGLRASDVGACHPRFRVFVLGSIRDAVCPNVERERPGGVQVPPVANESRERGSSGTATAHTLRSAWGPVESRGLAPGAAQGTELEARRRAGRDSSTHFAAWGEYERAIRRWERTTGRAAPRPTEPTGRTGGQRISPRFTEWMMGLPDGWVTDPAIWEGLTESAARNAQLKACGNGVVPQQAVAALSDMLAAFNQKEIAA